MAEFDPSFQRNLYLSPDQQDLLLAALSSNNQPTKPGPPQPGLGSTNGSSGNNIFDSPPQDIPGSGQLSFNPDDSPFLGLDLDAEFDVSDQALIGDLPGVEGEQQLAAEPREKRKSLDGQEGAEIGKKRKENEEKVAKKPGRKPLTSEPTTVSIFLNLLLYYIPYYIQLLKRPD